MLIKGHRVGGVKARGHLVGFGGVPVSPVVQRYFTENLAAGGMYSAMSSSVPILGDFELEFDFYRSSPTGGSFIFSNYDTAAGKYGLSIYSTGDYGVGAGTLKVFGGTSPLISGLSNNKYYKVAFKYVSATGKMTTYLNGAIYSGPVSSTLPSGMGTSDVSAIARAAQGSFYFGGIVANLKLWLSATRDPDTLKINMPLDEPGTTSVIKNKAGVLGDELWMSPSLGSGWTEPQPGTYSITADASYTGLGITLPDNGKTYLVEADYASIGGLTLRSDGILVAPAAYGTGRISAMFTANDTGGTSIAFVRLTGSQPLTATISNVSVKEIPKSTPYAMRINHAADDTELYQLNRAVAPYQWESTESAKVIHITGTP
jgi:hypothetical protein